MRHGPAAPLRLCCSEQGWPDGRALQSNAGQAVQWTLACQLNASLAGLTPVLVDLATLDSTGGLALGCSSAC